ncbi:hypothetical protein [Nocardia stercoris]|uniref:hypothetical protein n=1 Tax=Nocardia stercoris TaxID=2483361 RepID=UPI00131A424B|nr:hypothetical protein [Nocardia stercoris]
MITNPTSADAIAPASATLVDGASGTVTLLLATLAGSVSGVGRAFFTGSASAS